MTEDFKSPNGLEGASGMERARVACGAGERIWNAAPERRPGRVGSKRLTFKTKERQEFRRFTSEKRLEEVLDWDFEPGAAYHILSAGDIDSMSILRFVLRQQPLEYLLFSTWRMSLLDVQEFARLVKIGRIRRLDSYLSDRFNTLEDEAFAELLNLHKTHGGRVALTWNHSKTFVGFGPRFSFVAEGSANINTNRRIETTCVTINHDLALFYKDFFDSVEAADRKDDFPDWQPYPLHPTT